MTGASVVRNDDRTLTLEWTRTGRDTARVFWGTEPDAIDTPLELADPRATSVTFTDPAPGRRPYFLVKAGDTRLAVAERHVSLEGQPNFRDIGGYETDDGRHVRWGQIYRSGELGRLTDADLTTLFDALHIKLVCDLRSAGEVEQLADPVITGAENAWLPVGEDTVQGDVIRAAVVAGDLAQIPADLLVGATAGLALTTGAYAALMERLMDPANRPADLHCTGGKDRAGWGAAVTLLALGVPRATIAQDYLLSNTYRSAEVVAAVDAVRPIVAGVRGIHPSEITDADIEPLVRLLEVRDEYIQAAFDAIDANYGSTEAYLTEGLGLTHERIEAFRDDMLEDETLNEISEPS